jgi:hypothetical protein
MESAKCGERLGLVFLLVSPQLEEVLIDVPKLSVVDGNVPIRQIDLFLNPGVFF